MSRFAFQVGDEVRLNHTNSIPVRYQGRVGTVVERTRRGTTQRFGIDFGSRKATPLVVAGRNLTLAD